MAGRRWPAHFSAPPVLLGTLFPHQIRPSKKMACYIIMDHRKYLLPQFFSWHKSANETLPPPINTTRKNHEEVGVLRSLPIRHLQRCGILPALLLPLRPSHGAERRRQRRLGAQEARGRHRQRHGRAALHGEPDRPRQGEDVHHIHILRGAAGGVQSGQAHVILRDARSVGVVHDVRIRQGRPNAVV